MNAGRAAAIRETTSFVPASGRSFFGGKTSKETDGPAPSRMVLIFTGSSPQLST